MIPLSLTLSGFLSYRDPVELDFTGIDLACISGANGAGKSSLLDAITWALFGQARKRDESLVNAQSSAAEVSLAFAYEGNTYRIQRTLPRGKTSLLEFQIAQSDGRPPTADGATVVGQRSAVVWKALTERTVRDTQALIERTLRLDYDTFVNASFFLQGKADQFTQQRPGDRKRILGSILGLEIWEQYRQRAADRRKADEASIAELDGRLAEIAAELSEEKTRKAYLETLAGQLSTAQQVRSALEAGVENIRRMTAALEAQRKMVDTLARQLEAARRRMVDLELRAAAREKERETFVRLAERAPLIRQAYESWQKARAELEQWETTAARFREHEKRRQPFLDELNAARARLLQEKQTLEIQQAAANAQRQESSGLQAQVALLQSQVAAAEEQLTQRAALESELHTARERQAEAKAENPRLRAEMEELKKRQAQLAVIEGAVCPVCAKPLLPDERQKMIDDIAIQGKTLGDRYRQNQALLNEADERVAALQSQIGQLSAAETVLRQQTAALAQHTTRLEQARQAINDWENIGAPRLANILQTVEHSDYHEEAQTRLAEIDAELKTIGYDTAAHDLARQAELDGRASEAEIRDLEKAQAALEPLDSELANLQSQLSSLQTEARDQQSEYDTAAAALAEVQERTPSLYLAESELLNAQEQENRLRMEVGAAQQKVDVLADLKARRKAITAQKETLARSVAQYKQLERSFGKDGVPALLIEQALPQIESKANELLERLSSGGMTVRFVTQAAYKDKKRDDLKETLDIQISDGAGMRDYEMYSGGEAFRVNFAVRLALSEVLAQRAGARLQTLVIDEGFGSQDAQGRQRLIEAINLVRADFAKILVITHIDELKDAFPARIEVEKTPQGSQARIA